jgi:hypothetical protein
MEFVCFVCINILLTLSDLDSGGCVFESCQRSLPSEHTWIGHYMNITYSMLECYFYIVD